eukprot:16028705-Heterocapsa_arctica.AAC.1
MESAELTPTDVARSPARPQCPRPEARPASSRRASHPSSSPSAIQMSSLSTKFSEITLALTTRP